LVATEVVDGDVEPEDLRQYDLAIVARLGDTSTLLEQPVRFLGIAKQEMLQCSSLLESNAAVTPCRAAHQNAIGPEHRALCIDRNCPDRADRSTAGCRTLHRTGLSKVIT